MKKLIVRWTQVYESEVEVPKDCTLENWKEFASYFDFNTHVEGAKDQVDTIEVLDVREKIPTEIKYNYHWSPAEMAEKTNDAYSSGDFKSWLQVCEILKDRKFSDKEAEAILRSTWTRWCRDSYATCYPAAADTLAKFLDRDGVKPDCPAVEELVKGTFGS